MLFELHKSKFQNVKCPLMFMETSGLLLMLYSFHILTRADAVVCLPGKDVFAQLFI